MKIIFFLLSLLYAVVGSAGEFDGTWKGLGAFDNQNLNESQNTEFKLSIQQDAKSLNVSECWDEHDQAKPVPTCIQTEFQLENDGEVYFRGHRVGNIYPNQIVILISDSQDSEQMIFEFSEVGLLRYNYTYANWDGGMAHRKALLKK